MIPYNDVQDGFVSSCDSLQRCAGQESSGTLPLDFLNAAWKAANPNMFHVEVRYRGGVYVTLTKENQHVEYHYVDTVASQSYKVAPSPHLVNLHVKIPVRVFGYPSLRACVKTAGWPYMSDVHFKDVPQLKTSLKLLCCDVIEICD